MQKTLRFSIQNSKPYTFSAYNIFFSLVTINSFITLIIISFRNFYLIRCTKIMGHYNILVVYENNFTDGGTHALN